MNQIEDERIKFYLKHEARIRAWASLEPEVREFVNRFYRSIIVDLDAALKSRKITYDGVESFLDEHREWPGLVLHRHDWPKGTNDPDVRLEWKRKLARFSQGGHLICGVRANMELYKEHFAKASCSTYPHNNTWWPAYANVDPPVGKFWEGDNLKKYRKYLVDTILKAWQDLAPLVDKAVGHPLG